MIRLIILKKHSEHELLESTKLYDLAVEGTGVGIWSWKAASNEAYWSEQFFVLLGYKNNEIKASFREWKNRLHPDDMEWTITALEAHFNEGSDFKVEFRMREKSGAYRWYRVMGHSIKDSDNKPVEMAGSIQDIHERKRSEQAIKDASQKLEAVVSSVNVAIVWASEDGRIEYVNPTFSKMFGWRLEDVPTVKEWFAKAYTDNVYRAKMAANWHKRVERSKSDEGSIDSVEVNVTCKDGTQKYMLLNGAWAGDLLVATFSDISEQKSRQKEMENAALHDILTGLPNRALLTSRLEQHLNNSQRRGDKFAVVFLDLDGFKQINDDHGHDAGDFVLREVSSRLSIQVRETDTVGRLGGDEFAIVLSDLNTFDDAIPCLNRILSTISAPIFYENHSLQVSASLGVTYFPQAEHYDGDQLLRQADHAMYVAKQQGKNRYCVFDAMSEETLSS